MLLKVMFESLNKWVLIRQNRYKLNWSGIFVRKHLLLVEHVETREAEKEPNPG